MALCQRHSRDTLPQVAQQLWLGVLRCYVLLLRELRSRPGPPSPLAPRPALQQKAPIKLSWPTGEHTYCHLTSCQYVVNIGQKHMASMLPHVS